MYVSTLTNKIVIKEVLKLKNINIKPADKLNFLLSIAGFTLPQICWYMKMSKKIKTLHGVSDERIAKMLNVKKLAKNI
jgi:hypothetical protein